MLKREEFEKGIKQAIKEFKLKNPKVTKSGIEDPELTYHYTVNIESKDASVYIHTDIRGIHDNKPIIYCSMFYQNEFGLTQFQSNRSFPYSPGLIFFPRWISSSVHEFNNKKEKNKIDFIFGDRPIKILGEIGYSSSHIFEIMLRGYAALKPKKILIYKIRHIRRLDNRSFSWAIYSDLRAGFGDFSFWSVFPDCCGLDSGGALGDYNDIIEIINEVGKSIKINVMEFDIPYKELEKKLDEWFDSKIYQDEEGGLLDRNPLVTHKLESAILEKLKNLKGTKNKELEPLLLKYYNEIDKIFDDYEKKEYGFVLRSSRALLETIAERLCLLNKITFDKKRSSLRTISKLLKEKKLINERISEYIISFHVSASKSAHEIFPSMKDVNTFEKALNIRITILLGMYLILELIVKLRKHYGINDIEFYDKDFFNKF